MTRVSLLAAGLAGCAGPIDLAVEGRHVPLGRTLRAGCQDSPFATIQAAIDDADPGDVVEVCAGTYFENLTISGKELELRSEDGADDTVIDADEIGRALDIDQDADVRVKGFTFRNGESSGLGGNVRCEDSELDLEDCELEDGDAEDGGGLGMSDCRGDVEDNEFRDNHADSRGGGLFADGDDVDVIDNDFDDNDADEDGGGAFLEDDDGDIEDNDFDDNHADDDGGGLYLRSGSPHVEDNTFEHNDADDDGGGLFADDVDLTLEHNEFDDNRADHDGGGAAIIDGDADLRDDTWEHNTAGDLGGALLLDDADADLDDEDFHDNDAGDRGGALAILDGSDDVRIEDCTFDHNDADDGGHVYVHLTGPTTRVVRTDFFDGSADRGGAVFALDSDLELRNVLLEENDATEAGGALYLDHVTGHVRNSVAARNDADEGAAIEVVDGTDDLEVTNCVFLDDTGGAAVDVRDGIPPELSYDDFFGNSSDVSGMADPIGDDGNLGRRPRFRDANGDYHLRDGSALRDAGDPAIHDRDGTRSDIGLYGGPDA